MGSIFVFSDNQYEWALEHEYEANTGSFSPTGQKPRENCGLISENNENV